MTRTANAGSIAGFTPPGLAVSAVIAVHLAALLVLPTLPSTLDVVVLEIGTLVIVLGITALGGGIDRSLLVTAVVYGGSVLCVWGLLATQMNLWGLTLGTIAGGALLSYGLHRYELVTLGLVAHR